ncbi:glycoside hydrolase family 2 [Microbacterium sp. STN6]|uniref:glycoside hydrolase family 2 protein n=1 Tax=Microbacterium sp. STN6 TaxID=2995588 RepID=UPI0022609F5F|nr:glycoside hydrolase family 2 TIM barrel-domain containing protein [Microbacterium sp. STN6]MCX7521140.1 glycoside hydrolase family 2 [Microbacterium sp. STN6]
MSINHGGTVAALDRASRQDGSYPRPQLKRSRWRDLCGTWGFAFDDADEGRDAGWFDGRAFERSITVPFPPESVASGIGDTGFHRVIWYQRIITGADVSAAGHPLSSGGGGRLLLHFGAVDYRCEVWLDGRLLGGHEGGHTPFTFDITTALDPAREAHALVVRAEDDPFDVSQPRGKQDWQRHPHAVWYHRTSGIWQPAWLEAVPTTSVRSLAWAPDVSAAEVALSVQLSRTPAPGAVLSVDVDFGEESHGRIDVPVHSDRVETRVRLPRLANGQGYEQYLWSPEHPRLFDATVTLQPAPSDGEADTVASYFGMRSASIGGGRFLLNDRPYPVRAVLSQGYWPASHLAAPSADALRAEAQLIKDLGFNAARVHQKIEDPRFLFWADRLGLLLWGETPSAFEFSTTAVTRMMREWSEAIERDLSHPSIVTWVPLNESWGVQHIAHEPRVQAYSRAIFELTKALDPSRPVVSNDGWEHLDTDIFSIHDYEASGDVLRERYADAAATSRLLEGFGPAGRRMRLAEVADRGQPVMLTEFGGVQYSPGQADAAAWGYSRASSADDFERRLRSLFDAVRASTSLAGICYTQLTDTLQEANGLVDEERRPKLPVERIRAIVTGLPHGR